MNFFSSRGRSVAAEDDFDHLPYEPLDATDSLDLDPGERLGPPPRDGATMTQALLAVAVIAGVGWGAVALYPLWSGLLPSATHRTAAVAANAPQTADATAGQPRAQDVKPAALAEKVVADAPGRDAGDAVPNPPTTPADDNAAAGSGTTGGTDETDLSAAPAANDADPEKPQPLTPPVVDAADKLGKRALAVGLHPDLSRSLLQRMTAADYRNAGIAIRKALASSDAADVFIWPKKTSAKRAQFEIHFVAAAAPACRRYIVTVNKDRWATTAQPMEKCGRDIPRRGGNPEASG